MEFTYRPRGVCSQLMEIETEGSIIKKVKVRGGCDGNLKAICSLIEGMEIQHAIDRMQGIRCGFKSTSCPDQLSKALKMILEGENT